MEKVIWFAIAVLLASCVPVQPQQDNQQAAGEISNSVILQQNASAPAQPAAVEVFGGDEAALRAFMTRWFSSPYPGAPFEETKVYIGEMPPDPDPELPLPPGARVVGSIEGYYQNLQVLFDSELDPESVYAFYDETLGTDWRRVVQDQGQGFVPENPMGRSYCMGDNRTYLNLSAFPIPGGLTDVRLNLDTAQQGQYICDPPQPGYGMDMASQLIPTLKVPAGVEIVGGSGMGSSGDEANSTTNLKTTLTAGELAAHFSVQLQDLGWQLDQQQSSEGYAASAWRLTDAQNEPWMGYLIIIEVMKGSDRRYAYLQIEKVP